MKWRAEDWLAKADILAALYSIDRKAASRQLTQHRHFLEVQDAEFEFVSVHRVVHVLMGSDPLTGARSGQDIKRITADLIAFGFDHITSDNPRFDECWSRYLKQCELSGPARPSGGDKLLPRDRSFFLVSAKMAKSYEEAGAISPRQAVQLGGYLEGASTQVTTNRYERSPQLRLECIDHFKSKNGGRLVCQSCQFDFEAQYGEIGAGFIHVHHKNPLGSKQKEHLVDPEKDLIPLCPNCHAMSHRGVKKGDPPRGVAELQKLRKANRP